MYNGVPLPRKRDSCSCADIWPKKEPPACVVRTACEEVTPPTPKSVNLIAEPLTRTLAGFKSRWTMPCW